MGETISGETGDLNGRPGADCAMGGVTRPDRTPAPRVPSPGEEWGLGAGPSAEPAEGISAPESAPRTRPPGAPPAAATVM